MTLDRDPCRWVRDRQRVQLRTFQGDPHAQGVVVGYRDHPSVMVLLDDGREVNWAVQATHPIEAPEAAEAPSETGDPLLPFPTNADRICANAIAAALMDRYGYVRLSVRYDLARQAMAGAEVDAAEIERRDRQWLAEEEGA